MLPFVGVNEMAWLGTALPNWSITCALIVNVSSAVISMADPVAINVVGAPGITVTISVEQTNPKQAETLCCPDEYGVKTPVEEMLPLEADQTIGALTGDERWS